MDYSASTQDRCMFQLNFNSNVNIVADLRCVLQAWHRHFAVLTYIMYLIIGYRTCSCPSIQNMTTLKSRKKKNI